MAAVAMVVMVAMAMARAAMMEDMVAAVVMEVCSRHFRNDYYIDVKSVFYSCHIFNVVYLFKNVH